MGGYRAVEETMNRSSDNTAIRQKCLKYILRRCRDENNYVVHFGGSLGAVVHKLHYGYRGSPDP